MSEANDTERNNDGVRSVDDIKRTVEFAPDRAKDIAAAVAQVAPEKVEDVAAAVVQAAPEKVEDFAMAAVKAVPEKATDFAAAAVQAAPDASKKDVATGAVQNLSAKDKKDLATETVQDLSPEAQKAVAVEALKNLSPQTDKDLAVIQLAAAANDDGDDVQKTAGAQLTILNAYYNLALEQATRSFRWALIAAVVGLVFFLSAVGVLLAEPFLFQGQSVHDIAVVSVISGAIVEVVSGVNFYLYNKTTHQLAGFQNRLDQTQRFLLANSICGSLDQVREQTVSELVRAIATYPQPSEADSGSKS